MNSTSASANTTNNPKATSQHNLRAQNANVASNSTSGSGNSSNNNNNAKTLPPTTSASNLTTTASTVTDSDKTTTTTSTMLTPSASNPTNRAHISQSSVTTTISGGNTVAATTATKTSNNNVVNGSLSSDQSRASTDGHRTPNVENLSRTNLYIKGLQTTTSDQDLYNMCSRYGQISSTKAIIDKSTGCCRGYGFVEYTSPQAAELAVKELTKSGVQAQMAKISPMYSSHNNNDSYHHHHHHHHHMNHRNHLHHHHNSHHNHGNNNNNNNSNANHHNNNISKQYNQSSSNSSITNNNSNNPDPTNLYIANLPPDMSELELENLLSTYGPVVSTRILRDQSTNIPRGVGFARMESIDKCEQIIEQLNGRPCGNWKEPLLVKFADGGSKKRNHHNNQHHHNNSNHHRQQKVHQDESRWRDSNSAVDLGSLSSFDHQSNISHGNHLSDLAMMGTLGYPRLQPGFPPAVPPSGAYPGSMGLQTSAPQWIHHGGAGQTYVIPQQMIQAGGLAPSNQAAAAAALHYGHIPPLTTQMQSLQLGHPGAHPVGSYLPPQHQWPPVWPHPGMPQQAQPQLRLANPPMQPPMPQQAPPSQPPPQQSPQQSAQAQSQQQQQQQQPQQHNPSASDNKLPVSMPQ